MITKDKECKLVKIYLFICDAFQEDLKYYSERFTNNDKPEFTDEEVITIYLYVMQHEQQFKIKQIHRFAKEYLLSWFPKLHSYQAFINRLNNLSIVFQKLSEKIITENQPSDCCLDQSLLDSMPIITCSGKRTGKVAKELTDKGYNSTKGFYYYGLKLHALAFRRIGTLPYPEQILFTPASVNDLTLYKQAWSELKNRTFFGDKIYNNKDFFANVKNAFNSQMLTPIKAIKGIPDRLKYIDKAANELFSKAVSTVRQPIEALFGWLINKTEIQNASRVRSLKGLLVHIYGRISVAYLNLIF